MTPQLEAAIAAIQKLSDTERQKLLQILEQSVPSPNPANIRELSQQFWQGTTLQEILADQTPMTVGNLNDLRADFWPEEDSIEEFLDFLRQQRQEIT